MHHPKLSPQKAVDDAKLKAEQEKQRRDAAIAHTAGLRVLSAVSAAVPVRLLKRDLFFVLERLVGLLDENRVETLAKQHGIRQKREMALSTRRSSPSREEPTKERCPD